jgi:SpoVK/Ycf46/Vps4 family AAA+-type ATPase
MLTVLLPLAVYDRISSSSSPSLGLLLVGSKASGKTSVIRYIESIASNSPRIVAQTVTIDCKCLRGKPMKLVLDSLTALFTKASRSLPSLITIDNLDAICPAVDEIEGGPSVDESNIIAMHINKHFSYLRGQMCNESQDDNIPSSSNDDNNDSTNYDFIHVISKAMDKSVYVIATTSSRVNSLLLSPLGLKQQINVPFLSSSSRIEVSVIIMIRIDFHIHYYHIAAIARIDVTRISVSGCYC